MRGNYSLNVTVGTRIECYRVGIYAHHVTLISRVGPGFGGLGTTSTKFHTEMNFINIPYSHIYFSYIVDLLTPGSELPNL